MRLKGQEVIRCPYCSAEYLAAEIFYPDKFFGRPTFIERDENNNVISYSGTPMCLDENYVCDFCNKPFRVAVTLRYNATYNPRNDFDEDYVTSTKKESVYLDEE